MEHLTIALFFIVPMLITFSIGYIIGRMKSVDEWLEEDNKSIRFEGHIAGDQDA